MPASVVTNVRVRYAETDAQGVAHHSSYVVWFELGRSELLRAQGQSYREMEAAGYLIVVTDLSIRYLAAARYDDLLLITTTLEELRSRTLTFHYELRLAENAQLLATGRSAHVVLDRARGRPVRIPPTLLALFAADTP